MRAPTENYISQTQHGIYKAVDYSAYKDKAKTIYNPDYYAPEDGKVTALGNSGACGLRLELSGATGRHGFCHNEAVYVNLGDQVKKGQKLAKMGYTGTTVPSGPAGRHLHWVISKNGTYVYPPSLINEPFKEDDVSKVGEVEFNNLYRAFFGPMEMNPPSTADRQRWVGAETNAVIRQMEADPRYNAYTQYVKDLEKATGTVPEFLPYAGQQLYVKKEG